jgi:SAM-dependent methyltransferase
MIAEAPSAEIDIIKSIAKKLSKKGLTNGDLKYFFKPIDYTRTAELPAVLNQSKILYQKNEKLNILDVSSPQILSASIAEIFPSSEITYVNPFQAELDEMLRISCLLGLKNISVLKIDLTNENDIEKITVKYDYIFSSSVFEHIHPEEGGDILAAKNITKLLKSGGLLLLSVPFYKESFNEYKYGDVYAVKGSDNERIFFQRFYDEKKLNTQLINPSKLSLESILFLGERFYHPNNIHKRFAQLMQKRISSLIFGKFFFLISKHLFSYSGNFKELKKPYIAVMALRNIQ